MKLRSLFYLSSLLLCPSLFGQGTDEERLSEIEEKLDAISMQSVWGTFGANTAPANLAPNGFGLYLFGDYLYWRTFEEGVFNFTSSGQGQTKIITSVDLSNQQTVLVTDISLKGLKFDFDSGYRVGIGYTSSCHDNWNLEAEYTRFENRASRTDTLCCPVPCPIPQITLDLDEPVASFDTQATTTPLSESRWHIDFNNVDLVLGRAFFVTRHLLFHPFFGGKVSWIHQKKSLLLNKSAVANLSESDYSYDYDGEVLTFTPLFAETLDTFLSICDAKNDFWGVGPLVGVDAKWFLGSAFNLYATASGAALFGKFEVRENSSNTALKVNADTAVSPAIYVTDFSDCATQDFSYDPFSIVPQMKLGVGVAYDTSLNKEKNSLSIRVGYEGNYYWRQNYLGSPSVLLPARGGSFDQSGGIGTKFSPVDLTSLGSKFDAVIDVEASGPHGEKETLVNPNSPSDLAFHGLVAGITFGF